jgi:hypothetical protein
MSIIALGTGQAPDSVTRLPPLATQTALTQSPNAAASPPGTSQAPDTGTLPAAAAAHGGGPQGLHQSGTTGTIINTVG